MSFNCECGCHPALIGCGTCCEKYSYRITLERIEKLESERDKGIERIKALEMKVKELERFQEITCLQYKNHKLMDGKKPHKCPVCGGERKKQVFTSVTEDFDHREIDQLGRHFIKCKICEGKGIVWG